MASPKIIAFYLILVVIAAENVPINHYYNVQIQPCPPNLKENNNTNKVDNFFD